MNAIVQRLPRLLSRVCRGAAYASVDSTAASIFDQNATPTDPITPSFVNGHSSLDRSLSKMTLSCVLDDNASIDVWVAKKASDVIRWLDDNGLTPFVSDDDDAAAAPDACSSSSKVHVGFDIEWRPTFLKGHSAYKTALIQISTDKSCLLVQMTYLDDIPAELSRLLVSKRVVKVGVGVLEDIKKAARDYLPGAKIHESAYIDIGDLAKTVERTYSASRSVAPPTDAPAVPQTTASFQRHGLKALTRRYLKIDMEKPKKITMSNWEHVQLTLAQVKYAAFDAYLSKHVHNALKSPTLVAQRLAGCDNELISALAGGGGAKDSSTTGDSHGDQSALNHVDAVSYLQELLRLRSTNGLGRRELKYLHNSPLYNTIVDSEVKVQMNHMIFDSDVGAVEHLDMLLRALEETNASAPDITIENSANIILSTPSSSTSKESCYRNALHMFLARISCGYTAKRVATEGPDDTTSPRSVHIYAHLRQKGGVREGSYLVGVASHRNSVLAGEVACRLVYLDVLAFLRKHLSNVHGDLVRIYGGYDDNFIENAVKDYLYERDRQVSRQLGRDSSRGHEQSSGK